MAVTAGIDFGAALFINFLFSLLCSVSTTHWHTMVIYAGVLLLHGMMNQFGIRLVALLNNVSVWWHILGVLIIVGAMVFVLARAPRLGQVRVHRPGEHDRLAHLAGSTSCRSGC